MFIWKTASCLLIILCLKFKQNDCYRLSQAVVPKKYNVKIITYLDEGGKIDFTFCGTVKIKIKCLEPTKNITLNAKELIIEPTSTTLREKDNKNQISISRGEIEDKNDFYIMYLNNYLKKHTEYELTIHFRGKLTDSMGGFYASNYVMDGKKHWLATTQFQPIDARRAFPCFDEPSFKAKFRITLGHSSRFHALSNMPLKSKKPMKYKKDWVWSKFEESAKMSTYLIAYIVSDFIFTEPQRKHQTAFKIWSRKNAVNQTKFAAEIGPECLEYFEKYFNIKYPLPKQDMVAIPDFNAGAMENWGLVTYRETAILYDETVVNADNKNSIVSIIAHELAHQWFGNLVTMKWWTDIWLNEGFATYVGGLAVDNLYPKWKVLENLAAEYLYTVFDLDSLQSSHPVQLKDPSQIVEIFDPISYQKGSLILRMMDLFLGVGVLQNGLSKYLNKYAYRNAEQDNLWDILTKEAHDKKSLPENMTVKEIMDTWTVQTGYPVLMVKRHYSNIEKMTITQKRYFKNTTEQLHRKAQCWWVPITYTTQETKDFTNIETRQWLSCDVKSLVVENLKRDSWVILNLQAEGLYRVNYDLKNWKMLSDFLQTSNFKDIHILNRVLLIEDSMSLAGAGYLDYGIPFALVTYLKKETEYLPWKIGLFNIKCLAKHFIRANNFELYQSYLRKLLKSVYKNNGGLQIPEHNKDSFNAVEFQVLIAKSACFSDLPECLADASELFDQWMAAPEKPNPIPQDMRSVVYCQAIKQGSQKEWDFLWNEFKISNAATEKVIILNCLTYTKQLGLLRRYLYWAFNETSGIKKQDTLNLFNYAVGNEVGFYLVTTFFEMHIQEIFEWVGSNKEKTAKYAVAIASQITMKSEQNMMRKFIEKSPEYFQLSSLTIQQAIESMNINVDWHEKYYDTVKNIMRKRI